MSSIKIVLPGPISIRVLDFGFSDDQGQLLFAFRDAAHSDAVQALLAKAHRDGYAIEVRLLHYEGHPDKHGQDEARAALNRVKMHPCLGEGETPCR